MSKVRLVHAVFHPHSVELVGRDPGVIECLPQRLNVTWVLGVVGGKSEMLSQTLHVGGAIGRLDEAAPLV